MSSSSAARPTGTQARIPGIPVEPTRVLVIESDRATAAAVRRWSERAGCEVEVFASVQDAQVRDDGRAPEIILLGATDEVGALCQKARRLAPGASIVLLFPPVQELPADVARAAGAESFLVAPIKRGNLHACLESVLRIRALNERVAHLEAELARGGLPALRERQLDYELFKRMLVQEIRRSRRYRYPFAVALVAVDGFRGIRAEMDPLAQASWLGAVLAGACRMVREVDLFVTHVDGRFILLMPHTGMEGARVAAERLRSMLAESSFGGRRITVSIGLAAYEGEEKVSFGGLIRAATSALRRAQADGGDRVAESGGEPET